MERILYLPNERTPGDQPGFRRALKDAQHTLGFRARACNISPLAYTRAGRQMQAHLHAVAREFDPTIAILQHPVGTGLGAADYRMLRSLPSSPLLVYHEDDPYLPVRHPMSLEGKLAIKSAHIVYTCGRGSFAGYLRSLGARDVRYSRHCFDEGRFGIVEDSWSDTVRFNVVMIANRDRSRLPWRALPGSGRRVRLARGLRQEFGGQFYLAGRNWADIDHTAQPIPYDSQERIIRTARVSVNWDHFDNEPYYYSDRLPTSLAAGRPHVTTWHEGFDELFPSAAAMGLFFVTSVGEALERTLELMSRPDRELEEMGRCGRRFIVENVSQRAVYGQLLAEVVAARSQLQSLGSA